MRIGTHLSTQKGLLTIPEFAYNSKCTSFQIFLGSPRRLINKPRSNDELKTFGKLLKKFNIKMVVHSNYTINLCHPHKSSKFTMSFNALLQDLKSVELIGKSCYGVVVHMGKRLDMPVKKAMDNYINGLKKLIAKTSSTIILETGASQGTEIASKIEGLSTIYWALTDDERKQVKFCIDTCHIWATGYDISNADGVNDFFVEFDKQIGIKKIVCFHFNDSKNENGSCVDRHADLEHGKINKNGLKEVARFANKHNIPLITETPYDTKDITFEIERKKIKKWIH
jgi:deoxyribonuclease-4